MTKRSEIFLIACALILAFVAHSYNMFHFPYYENDEGTYISQAWALVTHANLAPYTYWYDHAPGGWILLALWTTITGGFFTFGSAIDSGRILMLLLHLANASLLIYIAKRLSGSVMPGIIAVLIFSLSPLGIYFQRRILLDNIMIFWMFVSLALLLKENFKLRHAIFSAITFGIGVLTKESAIFFVPAFLYIVYTNAHPHHKRFAVFKWITVSGAVVSLYFLYAILKGELFPPGYLGNNAPHVSLFLGFSQQLSRGQGLPFWNPNSDFYSNLVTWLAKDSLTIIVGGIATIISLVLSIKEKSLRIPAFLAFLFWLFLARGKLIIDFYVVPLIPLLALNIGMLVHVIANWLNTLNLKPWRNNHHRTYYAINAGVMLCAGFMLLSHPIGQYTKDETTAQLKAIDWIRKNVNPNAYMSIDSYAYLELRRNGGFQNADWYYKILYDPEITRKFGGKNLPKLEYLMLSHNMLTDFRLLPSNFIGPVFRKSIRQQEWIEPASTTFINTHRYESTYGDWAMLYKMKNTYQIVLQDTWEFYKYRFLKSYGQIIDPSNDTTTSEGQSYAMLRALWQNDQPTFDGVWAWTKDHLQFRSQDKLFSWLWSKGGNDYKVVDANTASDADQDVALALLLASKQWNNSSYLEAAKQLVSDIWRQEVVQVNGRYYLRSGAGIEIQEGYLINPSYLSPAAYRLFALVDPAHPWDKLARDSYILLNTLGRQHARTYLPPNWIILSKDGKVSSAKAYYHDGDLYGYDAFRTLFRVALDSAWFNNAQARDYLARVAPFFAKEFSVNKNVAALYNLNGQRKVPYGNMSTNAAPLVTLSVINRGIANDMYAKLFAAQLHKIPVQTFETFQTDRAYWLDKDNYYDQNWGWFGVALYSGNLPNLWVQKNQNLPSNQLP